MINSYKKQDVSWLLTIYKSWDALSLALVQLMSEKACLLSLNPEREFGVFDRLTNLEVMARHVRERKIPLKWTSICDLYIVTW